MQKCKDCRGLYQCHKVSKGMKQAVHVENHHLKTILVPCKYGKEILEKAKYFKSYYCFECER